MQGEGEADTEVRVATGIDKRNTCRNKCIRESDVCALMRSLIMFGSQLTGDRRRLNKVKAKIIVLEDGRGKMRALSEGATCEAYARTQRPMENACMN